MKVAVLGAAGGIGQALALLLKTQLPSGFRNLLYQVFHDAGVNVKQVGTIHTRFTRYTCRDKNDICAFQRRSRIFTRKTFDFHSSRDMAQIDGHTGSHWSDIIQREF